MTSDEIADEMVEIFNDIEDPVIDFKAENPNEVADAEAERTDYKVFVIPFDETEEPQDNADMCERRRIVSVVVNGPIDAKRTRKLAMKLVEQLRLSLEETEFGRYHWAGNETVSLWDFEALKDKRHFMSLFRAGYLDFA